MRQAVSFEVEPTEPEHAVQIMPEKLLIAAMLVRALLDALGPKVDTRESGRAKVQAKEWILTGEPEDDLHEPFTFCWVCQHLGVDHGRIRAVIAAAESSGLKLRGSHFRYETMVRSFTETE